MYFISNEMYHNCVTKHDTKDASFLSVVATEITLGVTWCDKVCDTYFVANPSHVLCHTCHIIVTLSISHYM